MAQAPYYRLKIKSLKFISAVDRGAQGPISNVALIKRAVDGEAFDGLLCKVDRVDPKLGLVWGWALATTLDGGATPHVDEQQDAIVGGDDLIKVAAEFMEASAASDVMHDENNDGRILFMLPLTADSKAALKISSQIEGLAIAMKPSASTFKRFVSGELNAFSIGGTGERTVVDKAASAPTRRRKKPKNAQPGAAMPAATPYKRSGVGKRAVLTSTTDGHAHTLDLDAPCDSWSDTLQTSAQTAEGAGELHSHAWVYDPATGAITIADDSGHGHTIDEAVPPDVLAEAAADDDADDAVPPMIEDEPSSGKSILVAVSARARSDSPHSRPRRSVADMDPKLAKMLSTALALTELQRVHVAKLAPDDQVAFLALPANERDTVVKAAEASNPVVYTAKGGTAIRASDGAAALELAKRLDAQDAQLAAQGAELAITKAAADQAGFEKRAGEQLSHFTKSLKVRALIIKGIDLVPGATDEERKEAHEAVKGANFALQTLGVPIGAADDGAPVAADPLKAWNDGLAKFAKSANIANNLDAIIPYLRTEEGKALKAAYDETRAYAKA